MTTLLALLGYLVLQAAPGTGKPPRTSRLVFTTANIYAGLAAAAARKAIDLALVGSHVVATQEMTGRNAADFVDGRIWGTVQAKSGSAKRGAIYYRKDRLRLVTWSTAILNLAMGLTFPSAHRTFTWARFQDRFTGRYVTVVDVHFVPHADDTQGGVTKYPRRRLVQAAIATLVAFSRTLTFGLVVILGDFNIDANRDLKHHDATDLVEQMEAAGFVSVQKVRPDPNPTHGRVNQYDQAFVKVGNKATVGHDWVHEKGPSDHLAYSFALLVTYRGGWPK